ncbi:S41 family peptidase [Fulvitalea axinellae]
MKEIKNYWLFVLFFIFISACSENDTNPEDEINQKELTEEQKENIAINNWTYEQMSLYYLWRDKLPAPEGLDATQTPSDLFDKLLYQGTEANSKKDADKWSWMTDDYEALKKQFEGISKSTGHSQVLSLVSEGSDQVIAIVTMVYPKSPAEKVGLKRGDIITKIDGKQINKSNYRELLGKDSYTASVSNMVNGQIVDSGKTVSLEAETDFVENPIFMSKVIEESGKKIGYLVYNSFIDSYNDDLDQVFGAFREQGVTDLILDLRYNPGGATSAAKHLSGLIGPASLAGKVFYKSQYNTELQKYLVETEGEDYLNVRFGSHGNGLGLNSVWVLTTSGSASASELVINGLRPYMTVTTVGSNTHGKYAGSVTFQNKETGRTNWALQPIILKLANADGVTDYWNGFSPIVAVEDDFFTELGDVNEGMLRAAINDITGGSNVPARKASSASIGKYFRFYNPALKPDQMGNQVELPELSL